MPKSSNQKLKLIYLMKILLERTDETHNITMPEIIEALAAYDISEERKGLYNDIENLRVYGLDVIGTQEDRTYSYHIGNRQFELAELKLLVDSVQSAKFITAKKSNELIKKIEGLASKYEASQLHRQVFVTGRVKTMNESIYYNVDRIHTAIAENSIRGTLRAAARKRLWAAVQRLRRHGGGLSAARRLACPGGRHPAERGERPRASPQCGGIHPAGSRGAEPFLTGGDGERGLRGLAPAAGRFPLGHRQCT